MARHVHISPDSICIVSPLLAAGGRVRIAPCRLDSTDDRAAAHLASIGVEIHGHAGMFRYTARLRTSKGHELLRSEESMTSRPSGRNTPARRQPASLDCRFEITPKHRSTLHVGAR